MKKMMARSVGLVGVVWLAVGMAFAGGSDGKAKTSATPLIIDWSQSHVIFSRPATPEAAARVQQDVRYRFQQRRQELRPNASAQMWSVQPGALKRFRRQFPTPKLHPDWAVDLGAGASVGAAKFPAKFSFDINTVKCGLATNPDFIVYGTGVPGATGTQGSIVAFTNLYSGCPTGPIPADYWSYNTGGTVNTSPVLSFDGTQIAFTQTAGGVASLVLLKWKAFDGLVQSPTDLTPVSASAYAICTAPCMTTISLGATDANSSVFYVYNTDTAFVGDDSGKLHQFTGIFNATPAEVTTGGWPATVSGALLSSPVHDSGTGNVFVEDTTGFLYSVNASGGVTASAQLDFGAGLREGPMVDSSLGAVYVFSSDDASGILGSAGVFQLSTTLTAGATGLEVLIGTPTAGTTPVYTGGFDNNYVSSADRTGNLYVCGNPGGSPTLYQISVVAGVMTTASAGPVVGTTTETPCSPVTDIYNPNVTGAGLPQEWVFLSLQAAGSPVGCLGVSCVMSFKVTQWKPSTVYNKGQEVLDSNLNIEVAENSGGTSGATPPVWGPHEFDPTIDGGVHWRNQGALTGQTPLWTANNAYAGAFEIIDSNNNIEVAKPPGGTSGATAPVWGLNEGDQTTDGTVTWINLGANAVAGLAESGGTSGIVIDNVSNITGASQIYFSTLKDRGCPTSGGVGGCAVQASQNGLQ